MTNLLGCMDVRRVCGVPEHFNLPWHLAKERSLFDKHGVDVEFIEEPLGTGAMVEKVRKHSRHSSALLPSRPSSCVHVVSIDTRLTSTVDVISPILHRHLTQRAAGEGRCGCHRGTHRGSGVEDPSGLGHATPRHICRIPAMLGSVGSGPQLGELLWISSLCLVKDYVPRRGSYRASPVCLLLFAH